MFKGCNFLIIKSDKLTQDEELSKLLIANHASNIYIKDEFDNSKNYMDSPTISHIITETVEFIEYTQAVNSMVPIVTTSWVYDSINFQKPQSLRTYNPNPNYFLKDCFICCCDNLPGGDKELIYGAVSAFGGGYVDTITKNTTHLIALDVLNEKAVVASSLIHSGSQLGNIKIVLPHWIDHCITLGKKLDEDDYLLPDPKILHNGEGKLDLENEVLSTVLGDSLPKEEYDPVDLEYFKGKNFYLSSDFNWSQRMSNSIKLLIERHGGKIAKAFDSTKVDIYLGKFRQGEYYKASCLSNRIIVGTLQWLYSIVVSQEWTLPLNTNILYYPIPTAPLPDFQGLKVSITNYSGDSRQYLGKLISIMGGYFTTTLTRENDYLVCAKASGKKFDAALNKWLDANGNVQVKVVNHLWLEDCFTQWALVNDKLDKYKNFGTDLIGMEALVGKTHLDPDVLKQWSSSTEDAPIEVDDTGNINDSMIEDKSSQSNERNESVKSKGIDDVKDIRSPITTTTLASSPVVAKAETISFPSTTVETTPEAETVEQTDTPTKKNLNTVALQSPPPMKQSRYGGRSAAKKAAAKLHDNMSDLREYQEMTKSKRKMKHYMENLEESISPKRAKIESDDDANADDDDGDNEDVEILEEKKVTKFDMTAIMTGCESEINLNKQDHEHLNNLGIKIITDFNTKYEPNTLIAPKILRTEKFLRSLCKVDRIIHPDYLVNILEHVTDKGKSVLKEYRIDDYSLDKVVKTIDSELGYVKGKRHNGLQILLTSKNRGKLFNGLNLNLSSNLNGGVPVIARILQDHGMKDFKEIKNSTNLQKQVVHSELNGENKIILFANKKKDTRLINGFKKVFDEDEGIVLDWDWCVRSIFKMKLQDTKPFSL